MARHRLASSRALKSNLDPCHTSFLRHPLSLLNISTHTYPQCTMKTTSGGFHNEERIESGQVDIANMVGLPTMGSLSVGGSPDERTRDIENHQEEKAYADPICEEDGISPDDAPEVVLDDIDEEVRTITL